MFQKKEERFAVKSKEAFQGGDLAVLVDKQQTGVNYLSFVGLSDSNLIPLLDRDGKPLTDTLPIENPEPKE